MCQNGTVRYPTNGIRFYSVDLINKLVKELSWARLFLQDKQDGIAADSSFMLVVHRSSLREVTKTVIRSLVWLIAASIETTIPPSDPTDRRLGLIVLIMFFAGVALACREVLGWWKARMDRFERPPLPKLITYEIDSDRHWLPTKVLWFRLPRIRAIPERSQFSVQEDRPTEVSVQEKPSFVNMEASSPTVNSNANV
jgi:hypothetical protein